MQWPHQLKISQRNQVWGRKEQTKEPHGENQPRHVKGAWIYKVEEHDWKDFWSWNSQEKLHISNPNTLGLN